MEDSSTEVQEYDRRWASGHAYSGGHAGYTQNFLQFMRRWLPKPSNSLALDVGCGAGFFSKELASRGFLIEGIDLSPVALSHAQEAVPTGHFSAHNLAMPLPFPNAYFDVVWCSEVLEHLFSPAFALAEFSRVLKPNGRLLVTVPYHGLLKNLAIAAFAFDRHYDPEYPHIRFFTQRTLGRLTSTAGFAIDELSTCGSNLGIRDWFFPTNLLLAARRLDVTKLGD